MTRGSWQRSPWGADPLSWFSTPNLPIAAAAITLVQGVLTLTLSPQGGSRPLVQAAALALAVIAQLGLHVATRPPRGELGLAASLGLAVSASTALVISALGYWGETFAVHLWWAPLALSLTLLAMSPYTTAGRLTIAGSVALAISTVSTLAIVVPDDPRWPPYSTVMIVLFPIIIGIIGGVIMIHAITERLSRWSERPLAGPMVGDDDRALVALVDAETSTRIADARALISHVLERGFVSDDDAAQAAVLAERLRAELTGDVDRTWLERIATGAPLTIDDPLRLADELDLAQRTALRALIDAVLDDSPSALGAASIELRRTDEGAVAVAVQVMSSRPEGRRESFLAPYYVSLRSTVTKLRWRAGPVTAIEFEVGGRDQSRPPAVQNTPEPGSPGAPRE